MATNYPSGADSFVNPAGTSLETNPDHAGQHTNINDAMAAMQTTVGTTAGTNVLKNFAAGNIPVRQNTSNVLQDSLATGTIGTFTGNTGTIGTFNAGTIGSVIAGTYLTVNSIPGSALSTNAVKLAYTTLGSTFTTTSATAVQVVPLNGTVTVPSGGRSIKITAYPGQSLSNTGGTQYAQLSIWKGAVATGTQLNVGLALSQFAGAQYAISVIAVETPVAGLGTYSVGLAAPTGGTATINGAATNPGFILVELI